MFVYDKHLSTCVPVLGAKLLSMIKTVLLEKLVSPVCLRDRPTVGGCLSLGKSWNFCTLSIVFIKSNN